MLAGLGCLDLYLVSRWSSSIQITLQSTTRNFQSYDQRLPQHWLLASHWWVTHVTGDVWRSSVLWVCLSMGCIHVYTQITIKSCENVETKWISETYWNIMILSGFCLGFPMVSLEFSRQSWRSVGNSGSFRPRSWRSEASALERRQWPSRRAATWLWQRSCNADMSDFC